MTAALDMSHDWRGVELPDNIEVGEDCFIQSAHAFGLFQSRAEPGLLMGRGSGIYSQSQLIVGERGRITVGDFSCINSATLQCEAEIRIGAHCLIAWSVVISDCMPDLRLHDVQSQLHRINPRSARPPVIDHPRPVVLEDNVWLGFGSVVLPGITIGEGAIVGTKTVVHEDVPPFAVVAGSPARIVRWLEPGQ